MSRSFLRGAVIALMFLFLGVAGAAAVMAYIPDPGSAPSIFDDFAWSSTANSFWHVNPVGATATIKNNMLTLKGDSIELDRRVQTDPYVTTVMARVRATHFHKFAIGLGIYHAGTISEEFDDDGVKCGRASDFGYRIDIVKPWKPPPTGQWFILRLDAINPYPNPADYAKVQNLDPSKWKHVRVTCSLYDSTGRLIASISPTKPYTNTHYIGLDEAYVRTWDSQNDYQVDWFYSGPLSGIPAEARLH